MSLQQIALMVQQCWEDGDITSAKCTTNLCDMFFKKNSNSATKVRRRVQHYSQVVLHICKTSVDTAYHSFEKCICLPKKILLCIRWAHENQWCFLITRKCYIAISFRINFDKSKTNQNPKKDLATSPETRVAGKTCFLGFCNHRSKQKADKLNANRSNSVGNSWDNRSRQKPKHTL